MKIITLAVSVMMATAYQCSAIELYREDGGLKFAKWEYEGKPVLTDANKQEIIDANVQFASSNVTSDDFTDISPNADILALSTSTLPCTWDGVKITFTTDERLSPFAMKRFLTTKPLLKVRYRQLWNEYQEEFNAGVMADPVEVQRLKSLREFLKRRYQAL